MRSKRGKLLWSKLSLKGLLKPGLKNEGFGADVEDYTESDVDDEDFGTRRRHSSCSTQGYEASRRSFAGQQWGHSSALSVQTDADIFSDDLSSKQQFRIFTGTWNVGGKPPQEKTNLEQWLNSIEPADIYVIGFQEIVPLNASNVLGVDDKSSVMQWLQLIQKALNKKSLPDLACSYADTIFPSRKNCNFSSNLVDTASELVDTNERADPFLMGDDSSSLDFRFPIMPEVVCLDESFGRSEFITSFRSHISDDKEACTTEEDDSPLVSPSFTAKFSARRMVPTTPRYALIARKRMVGIFLSVWVRDDLCRHVRHVKFSSVGCGIMGYLGNKGSISISLCLHQTTFCFICTHLTSGEKEGDELRRNYDVSVILKRTRFRRSSQHKKGSLPDTILDHDRILWFGDLNYRLALSSTSTKLLLARGDWETLLERDQVDLSLLLRNHPYDQLHIERRAGRVFKGWHEGKICFPPTYKYRAGSDCYAVERLKFGEKHRTPAWCDRILWYGKGLKQLEYVRAESNFSDHRPVYAVFSAEVEVPDPKKLRDFLT